MDESRTCTPELSAAQRRDPRVAGGRRGAGRLPAVRFGLLSGWVALSLLLTGCPSLDTWVENGFKVGPDYGRPPAPVAEAWIDSENEKVIAERCNYACWWTVFNDPVLNELVAAAAEQNLSLQTAGMRILEARYIRDATVGNLFPQQQQAYGSYTRQKISTSNFAIDTRSFNIEDHYDIWRGGFDATWELDIWGRYRRAIEAADASLESQIENYDDVLVILQGDVAANYIQFRTFQERIEYARHNVRLQQETLQVIRAQLDAGAGSELDYQQGLSDLANVEAAVPLLEEQLRRTHNRLCVLLGLPPGTLDEHLCGPGRVPATPKEVVVGIPCDLIRRRPDIRRAERLAAAQSAQIGIAESDLYPQFSLTGTIGLEARDFSELWQNASMVGSIGPGFRWNILNYGRILNRTRAEEARFYQTILTYQETVLRANEEVENGLVGFLREQERLESLRESLVATQKAYDLSKFSYERGAVDYQRLLDSQRALVARQDAMAESQGRVATNLVAIYKALGGGWETRLGNRSGRLVRHITVVDPGAEPLPAPAPEEAPPAPPEPEGDNNGAADEPAPLPPLPGGPAVLLPENGGARIRVNVSGQQE